MFPGIRCLSNFKQYTLFLYKNVFAFDKGERLHSAVWLREFWTIHRHGFSPPEEFLRGEIIQGKWRNFYRPCAQPRSQALSSLPPVRGCHCVVSSRNPVFTFASRPGLLSCRAWPSLRVCRAFMSNCGLCIPVYFICSRSRTRSPRLWDVNRGNSCIWLHLLI